MNQVSTKPEIPTVDFLIPQEQVSWFDSYKLLQEQAPVYFMESLGMYVLTRYEDLKIVLNDPKRFTVGKAATGAALYQSPKAHAVYAEKGWPRYQPLSEDAPVHSSYRKLIEPFLMRGAVLKREGFIHDLANRLVDRWIDDGEVDFHNEFSEQLPMRVICNILGLPEQDFKQLKAWSYAWALPYQRGLSEEQEIWVANEHVAMQRYLYEHVQDRQQNPKDDLISSIVHTPYTDPRTSEVRELLPEEVIGIIDNIVIGGNETTTFSLTSGMRLLIENPQAYAAVQTDRKQIPKFVEEVLRVETPVHGLQRVAAEDVELHGVKIPKGSVIHVRYGAANRDPNQFACPHLLDLERKNASSHMTFSKGEHFCPGSMLSRLEQKCSWEVMLDRLDNIRFAPGKNDFTQIPGAIFRSVKELHIQFDRRA